MTPTEFLIDCARLMVAAESPDNPLSDSDQGEARNQLLYALECVGENREPTAYFTDISDRLREAIAKRSTEANKPVRPSWRVGKHIPINVYDGDRPVCQCHAPEDAARIVEAMNSLG